MLRLGNQKDLFFPSYLVSCLGPGLTLSYRSHVLDLPLYLLSILVSPWGLRWEFLLDWESLPSWAPPQPPGDCSPAQGYLRAMYL